MSTELTAKNFIAELEKHQSAAELKKYGRYFSFSDEKPLKGDKFIGVRMGTIFATAREYIEMPVKELEKLLESEVHELRAGALSIMGQAAKQKNISAERLKDLYDLYIRRHDRINNWDLVDLAAYYVVGRYLADKDRKILYQLAKSKNMWERRTSIVATAHFIMKLKEVGDTFKIAEILMDEKEDLVHKGVGWMLRTAGGVDQAALLRFLDRHAAHMPRVMLRYSIEKLTKTQKELYMKLGKS